MVQGMRARLRTPRADRPGERGGAADSEGYQGAVRLAGAEGERMTGHLQTVKCRACEQYIASMRVADHLCDSCWSAVKSAFWSRVAKGGPNACWSWTAGRHSHGYGIFYVDGIQYLAHRVAFVIGHGPLPAGLYVCHRCDVPSCANPRHLFAGTQADNMRDAVSKGRQSRGQKHAVAITRGIARRRDADPAAYSQRFVRGEAAGSAILTESEVRIIRECEGTSRQVAQIFGVSAAAVRDIRLKRSWRHVE